ncbi:MAG: type I secretion C-terminal target domain-containing protein [Cyanobacteria bacterium P01_F01_bin.150]
MFGGSGRDIFVFRKLKDRGDRIEGFNVADDYIEVSNIISSSKLANNPTLETFNEFIQFTQAGSRTRIKIDADGNANGSNFSTLLTLDGIESSTLSVSNFVILPS